MYELIAIAGLGMLTLRSTKPQADQQLMPKKFRDKVSKLWDIAHQGMREDRLLRAEKALLTILKIDKKNAAAYNRLGILYAKQKEYKDAIDCFEIASSIEVSASSLHNLGLIYFETGNYEKAAASFEQAISLESNLAARHIAYAKVLEKLGQTKKVISELEIAVKLEPNPETYTLLARSLEANGQFDRAAEIQRKLSVLIMPAGRPKRIMRPRKVVI